MAELQKHAFRCFASIHNFISVHSNCSLSTVLCVQLFVAFVTALDLSCNGVVLIEKINMSHSSRYIADPFKKRALIGNDQSCKEK